MQPRAKSRHLPSFDIYSHSTTGGGCLFLPQSCLNPASILPQDKRDEVCADPFCWPRLATVSLRIVRRLTLEPGPSAVYLNCRCCLIPQIFLCSGTNAVAARLLLLHGRRGWVSRSRVLRNKRNPGSVVKWIDFKVHVCRLLG